MEAGKKMIVETIRKRTLKGIFAREGSSGTRARRYHPKYARKVGKNPGGPVDLYVTGQLHSSIRGKGRVNPKSVSATAYIEGSQARQKWEWLERDGSSPSRIKRRFMYITKEEGKKISAAMLKAGMTKKKK